MNTTSRLTVSPRTFQAAVPAAALGLASILAVLQTAGALVYKFGLSWQVAGYIVTLVVNGSIWYLCLIWPFLAPFLGTMKVILAVSGTGALVGW